MKNHHLSSPLHLRSRGLVILAGLAAAVGATAISAASAQAATTVPTTPALASTSGGCTTTSSVSQPFAAWSDANYYDLVPDGNFASSPTGWTLTGGAGVVAGGEPFSLPGVTSTNSLRLPAGSTAQTPYFCVAPNDPTFRFVAENQSQLSNVVVEVVYQAPLGITVAVPVGAVALTSSWEPSAVMATGSKIASALSENGTAEVALRFVATLGPSEIDDVLVDPRCK
jgi:hypothetical protein